MRSIRAIEYQITGVKGLHELIDMMRYDGMRFRCTGEGLQETITMLARRSCGLIDERDGPGIPSDGLSIVLVKDQYRDWIPALDRWRSFGMGCHRQTTDWNQGREIA